MYVPLPLRYFFLNIQMFIFEYDAWPTNSLNDNTQPHWYQNRMQQSAIIFLCKHHHHTHATTNMSASSDIWTTTDQKFKQAKQIYVIAERFSNAIVVLHELWCAIGDCNSSQNKHLKKSAFMKKIVIPLISDSIVNITTAAKILSPVSSIKYIHDHKECKRKREHLSTKSSILSPQEELIVHHMKDSQHKSQNKKKFTSSKTTIQKSCLRQSNWKQR